MTKKTVELAKTLVSYPSVTPDNTACQNILIERLKQLNFQITLMPIEGVNNFWALHQGNPKDRKNPKTTAPCFVFAGHTDVVPAGPLEQWHSPPFDLTERDGILYGRGIADMKGSIAAMVIACETFLAKNPEYTGSIGFLITGDEEGPALYGTQAMMAQLQKQAVHFDYVLIGEPSCEKIIGDTLKIGRRGSLNARFRVIGKQGHIAYPDKANNPIHLALKVLNSLLNTTWDTDKDPHFPPTAFQIANLNAGTGATNVIPEELTGTFNFRYSNQHTQEKLQNYIKQTFEKAQCPVELHWLPAGRPFLCPEGKLLSTAQHAIQTLTHTQPTLSTNGGTSDGRFIAPYGIQVLELGLCNHSIHAINEQVPLAHLNQLGNLYTKLLEQFFS